MNVVRHAVAVSAVVGVGLLSAAGAWAAASGNFTLGTSGASYERGHYQYDAAVPGKPGFTGVLYTGTLNNYGSTDRHNAYIHAAVSGDDWTEIARAGKQEQKTVGTVVHDPAATRVHTSKARVCRDRTILPWTCNEREFNR